MVFTRSPQRPFIVQFYSWILPSVSVDFDNPTFVGTAKKLLTDGSQHYRKHGPKILHMFTRLMRHISVEMKCIRCDDTVVEDTHSFELQVWRKGQTRSLVLRRKAWQTSNRIELSRLNWRYGLPTVAELSFTYGGYRYNVRMSNIRREYRAGEYIVELSGKDNFAQSSMAPREKRDRIKAATRTWTATLAFKSDIPLHFLELPSASTPFLAIQRGIAILRRAFRPSRPDGRNLGEGSVQALDRTISEKSVGDTCRTSEL